MFHLYHLIPDKAGYAIFHKIRCAVKHAQRVGNHEDLGT